MNPLELWEYWINLLPDIFEDDEYIDIGFLFEKVEIEPDGWGGINKEYYFHNGVYYYRLYHWDGGNFLANQTFRCEALSKEEFSKILNEKKEDILKTLCEEDRIKFEVLYKELSSLLLKQCKDDK